MTIASQGGVVGDYPSVATDRFDTIYVSREENCNGHGLEIALAR
jgi:hypothetical protein